MIDFSTVNVEEIIIHRVGSKANEEDFFISTKPTPLNDGLTFLVMDYFVKPFMRIEDSYRFTNMPDMAENELYAACIDIFKDTSSLHENSVKILHHLHEQSIHPHIKTGDLFVSYMTDLFFEDKLVSAVGIFKSESKTSFLHINENAQNLELNELQGIDVKKLDKGVFILNTHKEDGYRVFTVDSNNYDTEYWMNEFLNVQPVENEIFHTKEAVNLLKGFAKEVVQADESKTEEINFINKSVKYLEQNEDINLEDFKDSVIENPSHREKFDSYKTMFETEHDIAIPDSFVISKPVIEKQKKTIKNQIKLDTGIQINVSVKNPESTDKFVEQGYDLDKGMSFYKVYYNTEVN